MITLQELNALLDGLEQDPNGKGPFIGQRVSAAIRQAKYPLVWQPLIERYIQLIGQNKTKANVHLYCDMACTIITKKILMVDIFYLYDSQIIEDKELRVAHMKTAAKYLEKMITCIYECVYERMPLKAFIVDAASVLYAELYSEAFDIEYVEERDIFHLVKKWFCRKVLGMEGDCTFHNVAPGVPFLMCSHVYWLWLHLTAARVRLSAQDLLTVIYALDMIVYCNECAQHFLEHRSEFFFNSDSDGNHICYSRLNNCELLFELHKKISIQSASSEIDSKVLSEYNDFWVR